MSFVPFLFWLVEQIFTEAEKTQRDVLVNDWISVALFNSYHDLPSPFTIQCISSLVQNLFVCTLSIGFPRYIVPKGGAAPPTTPPHPPPFLFWIILYYCCLWSDLISSSSKTFFEDYCSTFFFLLHNLKGALDHHPPFHHSLFPTTHPLFYSSSPTPKWTTTNPTTPYFPFIFRPPVAPPHLLFRFQRSLATFIWQHLSNFNISN